MKEGYFCKVHRHVWGIGIYQPQATISNEKNANSSYVFFAWIDFLLFFGAPLPSPASTPRLAWAVATFARFGDCFFGSAGSLRSPLPLSHRIPAILRGIRLRRGAASWTGKRDANIPFCIDYHLCVSLILWQLKKRWSVLLHMVHYLPIGTLPDYPILLWRIYRI